MHWLTWITIALAAFDFFVNLVVSLASWHAVSRDREGLWKQKLASWWIGVVTCLVLPGVRILEGGILLMVFNDADPDLVFSLAITAVVVRTIGDVSSLLAIVWHWKTLRGHATQGWKRGATIFGEILLLIWILLLLALGVIKIRGRSSASHEARFSVSAGSVLFIVTYTGFPLVTYTPFYGMLTAWTKHPDFKLRLRDLVHNGWAMRFLFFVLLYTGLNTWAVVFPATALGRGQRDDPCRLVAWLCLSIGLSLLSMRLKCFLVEAQSRPEWIWHPVPTLRPLDGGEEFELASVHDQEG